MPQSQAIAVPLLPVNQAAPDKTGGPVGRLKAAVNCVWRKYEGRGGQQVLRVEKRNGFQQFPTTVLDPATGLAVSKSMSNPTAMGTLGNRLLTFAGAAAFVLSESAGCFESPAYHCPTQTLRATPLSTASANSSNQLKLSDSVRLGSRTMYTWYDANTANVMYSVIDDDGTIVRSPGLLGTAGIKPKVATDGTHFWSVHIQIFAGLLIVQAFDANGKFLGSDITISNTTNYYDITPRVDGTLGIVLAQQQTAGAGTEFHAYTFAGGVVVHSFTQVLPAVLCSTGRLGFLRNDSGDTNYYLITADGAGPFDWHGWQLTNPGIALGHHYVIAAAQPLPFMNVTGFVAPSGAKDITVILSFPDTATVPGPFTYRNLSRIYTVTFAGVTVFARTQFSLTTVSRPFVMNGTYYVVMFYQSDPNATYSLMQSTYFLLNLSSPWQICGRWDYGLAYADWQSLSVTTDYMHLASPNVDSSGAIHIPLMYRARSFTARVVVPGTQDIGKDIGNWANIPTSAIGIKDYSFGPDSGIPLEASGALLIPGPQCTTFSGNAFAEDGIPLIPELDRPVGAGAGVVISAGTREYVCSMEWTDDVGNRVLGPVGPPASFTLGAGQTGVIVTGTNVHVSTKTNLKITLYRSAIVGGNQTAQHYKVTSDITPLYNNDGTVSWTFTDTNPDGSITTNEVAYTDKGFTDRFPAPPHHGGCANADRVILLGYDNALWVSGPKSEGDAWWFSPAFRIPIPTGEQITKCILLDGYVQIYCATSNVFVVPIAQLPDATGAGPLPSPLLQPISNGCNGQAVVINTGVVYASAQGGAWITSRGLGSEYFGEKLKDVIELGGPVTSMATDKTQKLFIQMRGTGALAVYDQITGEWYVWSLAETPLLLATHKGLLAYVTPSGHVWRQNLTLFADIDSAGVPHAIDRTITIAPLHFGGIRNYKRVWMAQFEGEYLGAHSLTVIATYNMDDVDVSPTNTYTFTPDPAKPYVYELPPQYEEVESIEYRFVESSVAGSAGFALEMLGFEVGIEPMLGRVPRGRRIQPT